MRVSMQAFTMSTLAVALLATGCGCPTEPEVVADRKVSAGLRYQADGVTRQLAGGGDVVWSPGGPKDRGGTVIAPPSLDLRLFFGDRNFSVLVYTTVRDVGMGPAEIDINDERATAKAGDLGAPYHDIMGHVSVASLTRVCDGTICLLNARGTFTLSAIGAMGQRVDVTDGTFSANDLAVNREVCPAR